jgi:PPOX class probable F420-dependent enzyme
MDERSLRDRFASGRVARLATADGAGTPHVVPIVFVVDGDTIFFVIDQKPKRTRDLKRLRNIAANPSVAVLVDHYEDDWRLLWWVRADGGARVLAPGPETDRAVALLTERYPQYRSQVPPGPAVAIDVERWSGWFADRS